MTTFTFIHAADLHLDSPFKGLGRVDEELASSLRNASLRAFDDIIELAIERAVEFVVFAGDIYDGADRGLRAQVVFKRGLQRLADHGIEAFVIHGNHDPLDGWSLIRSFPDNTHVFGPDYEFRSVEREGESIATIHGVSYASNHVHDNLAVQYSPSGGGFQIGVLHTDVDAPDSPYAPCTLDDLIRSGMDYWALGHIHRRKVLCEEPFVVYPGNHQGRSFNEEGPRGVSVVEVRNGRVHRHEFVAVDHWRFETITVDVGAADDVAELTDVLFGEIEGADRERCCVIRVRLEGRSALHGQLARTSTEGLLEELRAAVAHLRPRVWVDRIEDRSRPTFNVASLRERDDFIAEVIGVADDFEPEMEPAVTKKHRGALARYLEGRLVAEAEVVPDARNLALELLLARGDR